MGLAAPLTQILVVLDDSVARDSDPAAGGPPALQVQTHLQWQTSVVQSPTAQRPHRIRECWLRTGVASVKFPGRRRRKPPGAAR